MAAETPVLAMQRRALRALYDAGEGMTGGELVPLVTVTANEKRAWSVILDLTESGRLERSGVGEDARYSLTAEEADDEFMRRYAAHRPPTQHDERSA